MGTTWLFNRGTASIPSQPTPNTATHLVGLPGHERVEIHACTQPLCHRCQCGGAQAAQKGVVVGMAPQVLQGQRDGRVGLLVG
jgi:hypothetical protein